MSGRVGNHEEIHTPKFTPNCPMDEWSVSVKVRVRVRVRTRNDM